MHECFKPGLDIQCPETNRNESKRFGMVENGLEWERMVWNGRKARAMYIEGPVVNSNQIITTQRLIEEDRTNWLLKDGDECSRFSNARCW